MKAYVVTVTVTERRRVLVQAPDENTACDMVQEGYGEEIKADVVDESYFAHEAEAREDVE